jgi:hypothetical protein
VRGVSMITRHIGDNTMAGKKKGAKKPKAGKKA